MVWAIVVVCLLVTLSFHVSYDVVLLRRKHRVGGIFWLIVIGVGISLYAVSGAAALITAGQAAPFWWALVGGGGVAFFDAALGAVTKRMVLKAFHEVGTPWTFVTPIGWISQGLVGVVMGAVGGAIVRSLQITMVVH